MKTLLVTLVNDNPYYHHLARAMLASAKASGWAGDCMVLSRGDAPPWPGAPWRKCLGLFPECYFDKLDLFTPYFRAWDRVVFVDADALVLRDLAPILKNGDFAACEDRPGGGKWCAPLKWQVAGWQRRDIPVPVGMNPEAPTFNTGVLVFSPLELPKNALEDMLKIHDEYMPLYWDPDGTEHGLLMHDQTLLNLYFYGRWRCLPLIYNLSGGMVHHIYTVPGLAVLHFTIHKAHRDNKPLIAQYEKMYNGFFR